MLNIAILALALVANGYVLVLRDGTAILLAEKPAAVASSPLVVAALADGTLVSLPEKRIDWPATEVANSAERQAQRDARAAQAEAAPAARPRPRRGSTIDNQAIKDFAAANPVGVPTTGDPSSVSALPGEAEAPPPLIASPSLDRLGRGEEFWADRARAVRDELIVAGRALVSARRALAAEEDTLLHGRTLTSSQIPLTVTQYTFTAEELGALQFRISQLREKVEDAEAVLAIARQHEWDLREEARKAGALPGWLRVP
jgi:hypothetical protein